MSIMDTESLMEIAYKALFNVDVIAMKQLERCLAAEDAVLTSEEKEILYCTIASQLDAILGEVSPEQNAKWATLFGVKHLVVECLVTFLILEEFCLPSQLIGFRPEILKLIERCVKEYDMTNLDRGLSFLSRVVGNPMVLSAETLTEHLSISGSRKELSEAYPHIVEMDILPTL
jgi:hypothetical protein